ncbi:hypothetical protein WJX72_002063 [[Myrmecia] bisecta]|uniref:Uncharacterized protein n=1 Tax=[Myrmecia] bisecta TaxID=41462 RepID=A0AAW1Q8B3_9CHLO
MGHNFVTDIRLKENDTRALQQLQQQAQQTLAASSNGYAEQALGSVTLEGYLRQAGQLFGKDPSKWLPLGEEKVDITEENGKRIIKTTSVCWGYKLSLFVDDPFHDERLPVYDNDAHDLNHNAAQYEIKSEDEWQKFILDLPWTPAVVRTAAAAVWGCATSVHLRRMMTELGVVAALLNVLAMSMRIKAVPDEPDSPAAPAASASAASAPEASSGDLTQRSDMTQCASTASPIVHESDRNQLQAFALGALSVLLVDSACRVPLHQAEPGMQTLLQLVGNLPGYSDQWTADRRALAARIICSCVQRDAAIRLSTIQTGALQAVINLLAEGGAGRSAVCFCMAAALAALVLDEDAMAVVKARRELVPLFESCISLLARAMSFLEPHEQADGGEGIEKDTAVKLAEAAAQAMWGASYHTTLPDGGGGIKQHHIVELGKMALHAAGSRTAPLGKVAHCIAATLATLSSSPEGAQEVMRAEGNPVRALLTLTLTHDDDVYTGSGHVKAAAATAVAFLASHPIGAKGNACLTGPHRQALLEEGALAVLLEAALLPVEDPMCSRVIEKATSVGVMYLCTVAGAVAPSVLAMLAAFMSRVQEPETIEYLMAGLWILLRNPDNQAALSTAFETNPANNKGMRLQHQMRDTIDVHIVSEAASRRNTNERPGDAVLSKGPDASMQSAHSLDAPLDRQPSTTAPGTMITPRRSQELTHLSSSSREPSLASAANLRSTAAQEHVPSVASKPVDPEAVVDYVNDDLRSGSGASAGTPDRPELDANWGLDTLVKVGETWIEALLRAGDGNTDDAPLVKLFEFLVASMCLFLVTDEEPSGPDGGEVYELRAPPGSQVSTWWSVAVVPPAPDATQPALVDRGLKVLVQLLGLDYMMGYKCMTLAVITIWNVAIRSASAERRIVELGACQPLLDIVVDQRWPACLRDASAGFLQCLTERWSNVAHMGGLRPFEEAMVGLVRSRIPLLELRGAQGIGRVTYKAPYFCPSVKQAQQACKASIGKLGGISALVGLLSRNNKRYQLLRSGVSLSPPRRSRTTAEGAVEDRPTDYERNMNNKQAILEIHYCTLASLLNLSIWRPNQVAIAQMGLVTLLATNYYFTGLLSGGEAGELEQRVVWLCGGILQNLALHPENRTRMYKAELRGSALTRMYKAELRGSALLDQELELGSDHLDGQDSLLEPDPSQAPVLPSLAKSKSCFMGPDSPRSQGLADRTAWGSAPLVLGPSGVPVNASITVRPKAKVAFPGSKSAGQLSPRKVGFAASAVVTEANMKGETYATSPVAMSPMHESQSPKSPSSPTGKGARGRFMRWLGASVADDELHSSVANYQRTESSKTRSQKAGPAEEYVEEDRSRMKYLHHLLRRPLCHLWSEDAPELKARCGAARWQPRISEYRQLHTSQLPMKNSLAKKLLHTAPPADSGSKLLTAAAELATTGHWSHDLATSVNAKRPDTNQRQGGRMAMTVLQQSMACISEHEHNPAQQGRDKAVGLKIVMAPQRARTTITFNERAIAHGDDVTIPHLTVFQHVPGARVYQELFQDYVLPNGTKAYYYYDAGQLVDEVEVPPSHPPQRPTSVPQALQQNMPLASILDVISKPPGSAPSFTPYKPVPRLVPLPPGHSLAVKHPESLDAAAFGDLREDNPQMMLVAKRITDKVVKIREEKLDVKVEEQREPWTLPASVFKPRAKESDARNYTDTAATMDRMFEADWARACEKEKFTSMILRENKTGKTGLDDKAALKEVHDMLKKHFQMLYSCFVFYGCSGGSDTFHIGLNAFTAFLDDCKIPDPESQSVKRSDCDTVFIVANFQPDKKSPACLVNDEHALMRFEFLEAVVRLGIAKYGRSQETDNVAEAVATLIERNLMPSLPPGALIISNEFRNERLYCEEVDEVYKRNLPVLKALYSRFRMRPPTGGLRLKVLKMDSWMALLEQAHMLDAEFGLQQAQLAYMWSRMAVVDEIKDYARYESLSFMDLLEVLGRMADMKSLPTSLELSDAGFDNILQWHIEKESSATAQDQDNAPDIFKARDSARLGATKSRPLYAKLEVLLELIFRRLSFNPAQPNEPYSLDAVIRILKKADKDMGS